MKNFSKGLFRTVLVVFVIFTVFLLLPLSPTLKNGSDQSPLRILDRNHKLLYEVRSPEYGKQEFLRFEEIPKQTVSALISVEDQRFYAHWGVSPSSILRALWQNFKAGEIVSGASTITQQLVRIRLQPEHRGYLYKIKEALLAIKLETRLSKQEILEAYLNTAYFGQQAYGFEAASKTYFDKEPAELSLAETAFLIGLLQSPEGYDPYQRFDRAQQRQQVVLQAMRDTESISTSQQEQALEEPLNLTKPRVDIRAPHFVFWLINKLKGVSTGQEVVSTLDLELQTEVETIVTNELEKLKEKNVTSSAVVVLDVHSGELLSMVGSADYFDTQHDGQVNVAVSSRQPGSALKPFTYALALAQGDTAATTVADVEAQFFTQEGNPYIPRNYDYGFHGLVRYREALANSYNIPAVKVLEKIGVSRLLEFLRSIGLDTLSNTAEFYGVALTLGSGEVRLLDLTLAYGIFPRGGKTLPLRFLADDSQWAEVKRNPIDHRLSTVDQILDEKIAWLITDILSDNEARIPEFGETSSLSFDRPVAAKTGTTRNSRDNWTIGFTPDYLVGVWVGNADNSPMIGTSGVTGAGPIFHAVMEAVTRNTPPKAFHRPAGLVQQEICQLSGKLPTEYCPHTMREWFVAGTEPKQKDDVYQPFVVDTRNGLLAGSDCDPQFVQEKGFVVFPPELEKWARENGYAAPPREYSPHCMPPPTMVNSQKTGDKDHRPSTIDLRLSITKPNQGDTFQLDPLIPDEDETIIFEARADAADELIWFVDGKEVGKGKAPDFRFRWQPQLGKHQISVLPTTIEQESMDAEIQKAEKLYIEVISK